MRILRYRNRAIALIATVAFFVGLNHGYAEAHVGTKARLKMFTAAIEKDPKNAELWFQRAETHRSHQDYKEAIADYQRTLQLDGKRKLAIYGRGLAHFGLKHYPSAKKDLDAFLKLEPNHGEACWKRALVEVALKNWTESLSDFRCAADHITQMEPDLFFDYAASLERAGSPESLKKALLVIDEGIAKLGPGIALELRALDLDLKLKNFDSAIKRVDLILAQAGRKEQWYAKKGDILVMADRSKDARENYAFALESIEKLPESFRVQSEMQDLRKHVKEKLALSKEEPK